MRIAMLIAVLVLLAPHATAEVTSSAANGFVSVNEVIIEDGRAAAWVAAVGETGKWWDPNHTVSGDASRMSIEAKMQGCFCESLGEQAGVVHLVVTMVNPTNLLRMTGGLGPLGLMGVDGNMTWEFEDAEGGALIRFTYAVGGYREGGLDEIAPAVDYVLGAALGRLKAYAETGDPEPAVDD